MSTGILIAVIVLSIIGLILLSIIIALLLIGRKRRKALRTMSQNAVVYLLEKRPTPLLAAGAAPQRKYEATAVESGNALIVTGADEENEDDNGKASDFAEESESEVVVAVDHATGKKTSYRFNFSYKAKLLQSPPEQQTRYMRLLDEVRAHPKLQTSISWRQERIYCGRKWIASFVFKGRRLCVAFALDPLEFVGSKYEGLDVGMIKRFEKTPMLLKITSERRTKFACELLQEVARRNDIRRVEAGKESRTTFKHVYKSTRELIRDGLVKVLTIGKGTAYEKANIGELIKGSAQNTQGTQIVRDAQTATAIVQSAQKPAQPVEAVNLSSMIRSHITREEAEELLPDAVARGSLVGYSAAAAGKSGKGGENSQKYRKKCKYVNIDTLSKRFEPHSHVNLKSLIANGVVPPDTKYVKILARGVLDKPLYVEAQDFSLDAVKMILLVGGKVKKV